MTGIRNRLPALGAGAGFRARCAILVGSHA